MEFLGYIASFVMGITLGVWGGGGSILTVPIMVYLFGLTPTLATGHSLFVVGLTALIGSSMNVRKGNIDFKTGFIFAIPSLIGVNISRGIIIPQIPDTIVSLNGFNLTKEILIMGTFALLMITASVSMIKRKQETKPKEHSQTMRIALIIAQGLFVGLVAGFVGAGGGFLILPALVLLAGLSMRVAVGTSLMVIAIQSLLGFAGDLYRGTAINWYLLAIVSIIAAIGIIVGSMVSHRIKEQHLKTTFGWFVLLLGFAILIEQFYYLTF